MSQVFLSKALFLIFPTAGLKLQFVLVTKAKIQLNC